jgi:hypothetical protein
MNKAKSSTIKISFKRFVKDKLFGEKIQSIVQLANKIVTEGYHLFNLHIIRLLENGKPVPVIDQSYIKHFLYKVSSVTDQRGRPQRIDKEIEETFKALYEPLRKGKPGLIRSGIDFILQESATDIATCINTNITTHFFKRQRRYIQSINPKLDQKEIIKLQNEINENKEELIYHPKIEESVPYDLMVNPEKFLLSMYQMNLERERKGDKLFSVLPIRRGFVPKNIRISCTALEFLAKNDEKAKDYFKMRKSEESYLSKEEGDTKKRRKRDPEINNAQLDILWEKYFYINRVISKTCSYRFAHHITTDGISVGVLREHKTEKMSKKKKKNDKKEKMEIDVDLFKGRTIVGVDPGKRSISYMTTDDKKKTLNGHLEYTNVQRAFEMESKHFSKWRKEQKTEGIQELENELSQHNTRTSSIKKFQEYLM